MRLAAQNHHHIIGRAGKYLRAARIGATLPLYGRLGKNRGKYASWLKTELEDFGVVFVKIGQWIASRTDVFPRDITAAFSDLQKHVKPMTHPEVQRVLRESNVDLELGDLVSSGSIAQVHQGLAQGKRVAVKIQRPGLLDDLAGDLDVVRAMLFPLKLSDRKSYDDAIQSLRDLGDAIRRETDFELEAANMDKFRKFFAGSDITVPRVRVATPRVLVMDYVPSEPVTGPAITGRLVEFFFAQILRLGAVHTDLHAGNLGIDAANRLVVYDFGSVVECSQGLRDCIKRLCVGYMNRNPSVMLDYMCDHGMLRHCAMTPDQRESLEAFVSGMLDYVEHTDISKLRDSLLSISAQTGEVPPVEFSSETMMIFRSFTLLEGLCKDLDPDFAIMDAAMPAAMELLVDPDIVRMKVEDDVRTMWKFLDP